MMLFWIFLSSLFVRDADCFTVANETGLRNELLAVNSYDLRVRPDATVIVQIRFNLLTIHELNIRDQTFKVTGWLTVIWSDSRLTWTQGSFGDVGFIFATEEEVWRPVLIVSNSVENVGVIQDEYTPFRIVADGRVIWDPVKIFEVNCEADITYYPFDSQECRIIIQSWSYNLREVDIKSLTGGINMNQFKPNGEWLIKDISFEIDETTDIKNDTYSRISFIFQLRRRSEYYWLNVLIPVIVNSILMALVFALPAESGEKMGYSLTVLLSFVVLLTLVADKIPSTSIATSIIVIYFTLVLILGAVSVFLSTIILDFYFRDDEKPISKWLMYMSRDVLGKLVCYSNSCCQPKSSKVKDEERNSNKNISLRLKESQQTYLKKTDHQETAIENEFTWKDISKILDRFFLWLYLIVITAITIGFITVASSN